MVSEVAFGWGLLMAAGSLSGFCSGLLGIGGGLIIVPVLIFGLPLLGEGSPELVKIAMATSLASVIPSSLASTQAHASRGNIDWELWAAMAPSIVIGGILISLGIEHISAVLLIMLYVAFALMTAGRLLRSASAAPGPVIELTASRLAAMSGKGVIGGAIATALGLGVGFFAVPILSRFMAMPRAIGTTSALALPMAIAGVAGYVFAPTPQGCGGCTGYTHIPAVAAISICAVLAAPLGAQASQKLPVARLRQSFAILLIFGAVSLLHKKLPEISAEAHAALSLTVPSWSEPDAPAAAPSWLGAHGQEVSEGLTGDQSPASAPTQTVMPEVSDADPDRPQAAPLPPPSARSLRTGSAALTVRRRPAARTRTPPAPAAPAARPSPALLQTLYGR
jgi:uncharacterized protein